jgi:hypothetical protein
MIGINVQGLIVYTNIHLPGLSQALFPESFKPCGFGRSSDLLTFESPFPALAEQ